MAAFDKHDFVYTPDKRNLLLKKADGVVLYYDDSTPDYAMLYVDFYQVGCLTPYKRVKTFYKAFEALIDDVNSIRDYYSNRDLGVTVHHVRV